MANVFSGLFGGGGSTGDAGNSFTAPNFTYTPPAAISLPALPDTPAQAPPTPTYASVSGLLDTPDVRQQTQKSTILTGGRWQGGGPGGGAGNSLGDTSQATVAKKLLLGS